jgi:hypothetical protein
MHAASYTELLRYDGAVVERDQRDTLVPCALQPRDIEVIRDVWRLKFLTATQLLQLHWPGRAGQVGRRRLAKLFHGGHLDRFRPITRTGGSFPWTYQLGKEGHRVLREIGVLDARARFDNRPVYDYRYVLHEVHLNSWVITWQRALGPTLVSWDGESEFEPPPELRRAELRLDDDRSVEGLRDARPRLVRPDAVLEIERRDGNGTTFFLIEYDRTRRVDKNFEKFLRYDCLLCWWWRHTRLACQTTTPFVVFVCQDDQQRTSFLDVADRQLTGQLWHPSDGLGGHEYPGRDLLFSIEADIHRGIAIASRVPAFPPSHPGRTSDGEIRGVRLPTQISRTNDTVVAKDAAAADHPAPRR